MWDKVGETRRRRRRFLAIRKKPQGGVFKHPPQQGEG